MTSYLVLIFAGVYLGIWVLRGGWKTVTTLALRLGGHLCFLVGFGIWLFCALKASFGALLALINRDFTDVHKLVLPTALVVVMPRVVARLERQRWFVTLLSVVAGERRLF